jgi:hypothetical protein
LFSIFAPKKIRSWIDYEFLDAAGSHGFVIQRNSPNLPSSIFYLIQPVLQPGKKMATMMIAIVV